MATSAYIHIPFCKSKCKYCSFISFTCFQGDYVINLLREVDTFYQGEKLKTLYFGGGTPSLLNIDDIEKIVSKFKLAENAEVTFEMNPDDAEIEYLKKLRSFGINRLSLGAQTFDDEILKLIGRRHSSEQTIKAVNLAKHSGFDNINLDLIYGLPNTENLEILDRDLEIIKSLEVQHISTYGLKIEEGSYFYKNRPENIPDDDLQADMYLKINETLENAGYKRYEVSNFAHTTCESRHNLNYWNNEEYYGFGVAAHGYLDGVRYFNSKTFDKYSSSFREIEHRVSDTEKLEEEIFLGFRKEEGIDIAKINNLFNIDFENKYKAVLKKYTPEYITKTPRGYKLTLNGVLLSNIILAEFLV